jgi:hypothetical protein
MQSSSYIPAERRAFAARLSALLSVIVLMLVFTSVANAASPKSPKLLGSFPSSSASSPATTTSPLIVGEAEPEDGIIIERAPLSESWEARFGVDRLVPGVTKNPDYEIEIFEGSNCSGTAVAVGTAAGLEGEGISVTVLPNVKTVLSADQVDPARPSEPSPCSNALSYWEGKVPAEESSGGGGAGGGGGTVTTPPPGPTTSATVGSPAPASLKAPHIHTSPGGHANNSAPLVVGSAPGASSVTLYAGASCASAPVAQVSPGELSAGVPVGVAQNAETIFSAVSFAGGTYSPCSEPSSYFEDSSAPRTRITMGPGTKTRRRKVALRFVEVTQDPPGTTFACKTDKGKWKACSSPLRLAHLTLGQHVVAIRATDVAGNVERKPVKARFKVIRP